jgi:hypothetical protein
MFDQNKEWVKFRQIFRGLHRNFDRAKRPNRITEYDIPAAQKPKLNRSEGHEQEERGATIVFDPCKMLDDEFASDLKRERDLQEKLYGKEYVSSKFKDESLTQPVVLKQPS